MAHRIKHLLFIFPISLILLIYRSQAYNEQSSDVIGWIRSRRATAAGRVLVVSSSAVGQLFTLESTPADATEVFQFVNPAPRGLTISAQGIVSRQSGFKWNATKVVDDVVEFMVNVSKPAANVVTFSVKLILRDDSWSVFTNRPQPMWTTSPVWIRPDVPVYRLQARAEDDGADVTYRLEAGGDGLFKVDPLTGEVSVSERRMFNLGSVYTLAVSAQCVGVLPSAATPTQSLSVQIGTRAPQLDPATLTLSFTENVTNGGVVGTLMAKSFQGLPLRYGMTLMRPTDAGSLFSLDQTTGVITLTSQRVYSRDVRQYVFSVNVNEQYTDLSSTDTLIIYLKPANYAPRFLVQVYVNNRIQEEAPQGTNVVEVQAFDPDPGDLGSLSYTVDNDQFQTVPGPNGGAIIQVAGELNYEYLSDLRRYEFNVRAIDQGSPPLTATASVQVYIINSNNRAPVFEPVEQVVLLKEGAMQGLAVHYIQAYDPDGDRVTFQLDTAQTSAQAREYFNVDQAGMVTLLKQIPRFGGSGAVPSFVLFVRATDDGSCCNIPGTIHTSTGNVTIKIQRINTQPVFSDCATYNPSVDENSNIGTAVLEMMATDNDIDDDGRLNFTIVDDDSPFEVIKMDDGRKALLRTRVVFNRENPQPGTTYYRFNNTIKYPVTVKVQDAGRTPLATNCFMLVTINDINDNAPSFDYSSLDYTTSMLTNGASGDRVLRVYATDADSGLFGSVQYEMSLSSSATCRNSFSIDAQSGWITRTVSNLPVGPLSCVITAKDGGSPARTTNTVVTINVVSQDQNLLPDWLPVNSSDTEIDDYSSFVLSEDTPINTILPLSLRATTQRAGNPSDVGYFLSLSPFPQLNGQNDFELAPSSSNGAVLRLAKQLDAANVDSYLLRIRAFSPASASSGQASVARLRVSVRDVNNKRPQFLGMDSNGIYPAAVSEYTQSGEAVIYVTAIDLDRDYINNKVTYSFSDSCSDCRSFSINADTGLISTRFGNFSRDAKSSYVLTVEARDGTQSSLPGVQGPNVASRTVSVQVNGVSSMPPYFTSPSYSHNIDSGPEHNTTLFYQTATDPDDDNSYKHVVQYGIESGNEGRRFAVDSVTGRVYNVREIVYNQQQTTYTLTYRVFDGAVINKTRVVISVNRGPRASPPTPVFNPTMYTSDNQGITEGDQSSVGKLQHIREKS